MEHSKISDKELVSLWMRDFVMGYFKDTGTGGRVELPNEFDFRINSFPTNTPTLAGHTVETRYRYQSDANNKARYRYLSCNGIDCLAMRLHPDELVLYRYSAAPAAITAALDDLKKTMADYLPSITLREVENGAAKVSKKRKATFSYDDAYRARTNFVPSSIFYRDLTSESVRPEWTELPF